MKIQQITRFIEKDLRKKILNEVRPRTKSNDKLPKITNERDLESSIYFWLRKKIGKDKKFKIGTNFSVQGYRKKGASEESQMMPDIVILEWKGWNEKPEIKLMMELKMMEPSEEWPFAIQTKQKSTKRRLSLRTIKSKHKKKFKKIFKTAKYSSDFRKLNVAKRKKWVDHSYFVYLYHSPLITPATIKSLIKKSQDQRSVMRFESIVINSFEKKIPGTSKVTRGMRETQHKAKQLAAAYPKEKAHKLWKECDKCGKLEGIHSDSDRKKCGLPVKNMTFEERSQAADKAHRTRNRQKAKEKAKRRAAAKKAARTRKSNEAARRRKQ